MVVLNKSIVGAREYGLDRHELQSTQNRAPRHPWGTHKFHMLLFGQIVATPKYILDSFSMW